MVLSWNEIKTRAVEFSKEWENETSEDAESKSFWDSFFNVFGITRKRLASFEQHVKKLNNKDGWIDLFWPGTLIVEHKSRGLDLDKAFQQAIDYFPGLLEAELPKYILVSDFARFRLYDLETNSHKEFALKDLQKHVQLFGFIAGYQKQEIRQQDPANIKAAELMAEFHDSIAEVGYTGHQLEIFLVRVLFCLFAEDTGIFQLKEQFRNYVEWKTKVDGTDLGSSLHQLFEILNTHESKRQKTLDEELVKFPYVDGGLFAESLPLVSFNSSMRRALLECCKSDWSNISPAIFGSMFQGVIEKKERRALGAHYTSEINILKLIKPLFLDELWEEFKSVKNNHQKLQIFQKKIAGLKFLDPACGCGNFLVIAYRELRLLELEILKLMYGPGKTILKFNIQSITQVSPEQFYGIEIGEFAGRIAETAMWLVDHQMNQKASEALGQYFVRLPLVGAAHIKIGNALTTDWKEIIQPENLNFILGNPPFVGSRIMDQMQKNDMIEVFGKLREVGFLDYVTAWYYKATKYIQDTKIKCAFVSTNSITQGEQAGILWNLLMGKYKIKIHFAHRTFKWSNEARGKAAVYCVIIGFAAFDTNQKIIYEYEDIKGDAHKTPAKNINPYLVDADDIIIRNRQKAICDVPEISFGNMPRDGGHLIFTDEEKATFLKTEPGAEKFIKRFIGAQDFLHNEKRWCLWLIGAEPEQLQKLPEVLKRVEQVKEFRQASKAKSTREFAKTPGLFAQRTQPNADYILIPSTSSENRKYIPIGFMPNDFIVSNSCHAISDAKLYHFGVLESEMHMAWVRQVCGRLKSDFRYSKDIVYNNFSWPENPPADKVKGIEQAAQKVLDVRLKYPTSSLADLYDPLTMPADLVKAHQDLDHVVDSAYTRKTFAFAAERLEFLFELYKKYTL